MEWQRVTMSHNEWYNEGQRMTTRGTTSDNEWQRMKTSYNKWQRVKKKWKQVTTSNVTSASEWQQVVQQIKTDEGKWKRLMLGFKMKQKANLFFQGFNSIFYATYNYNIFNIIDYL